MSSATDSPPSADLQRLTARVQGLEAALNQARNARRLLTIATLALVGSSAFAFYKLGDNFRKQENLQILLKEAETRFNSRSDDYMREVQALVKNASPKVTAAFYAQAKHDMPLYLEAMGKQREQLLADLQANLESRLAEIQERAADRHMKVIDEEFPDVKNAAARERMLRNLQAALHSLAKKYYVDQLREQVEQICAKLDTFPPAAAPRGDDAPLEDQLMANMLDLPTLKLAASDGADSRPVRRGDADDVAPAATPGDAPSASKAAPENGEPTAELAEKPEASPAEETKIAPPATGTPPEGEVDATNVDPATDAGASAQPPDQESSGS